MITAKIKRKKYHIIKKGLEKGLEAGLKDIVELLERKTKEYAPVDTGSLKNSITSSIKKFIGKVKVKIHYAGYQEYGTYKMSAANNGMGYLRPAVAFVRTKISAILGKNIRNGIRRN